ncbi:MAG: glycosyltransferase family 9 protein [Rhodospirillales bacterium]|nr:glycosyltransferase family 9 protein [Rhodospirillales bacterium]MCB9997069.1 glycosyltransferase family 9 protein [Rhodospirillales bacterium]
MPEKENILVIKLSALGDFIQALGPMAAIRAHHPDAAITLLTTKPLTGFGQASGYFDDIWIDERPRLFDLPGWLRLRGKLNYARFTRVYDLQNNDRTALYFKLLSPKPEWVGAAKGASHRNNSPGRTAGHAFDGHVQTLGLAGISNVSIDPMDWVDADISRFEIAQPYMILVPGCAPNRPEKRWPADRFAALAKKIATAGITPVIIGTESEQEAAEQICRAVPQTVNLIDQTSLFDIVVLGRNAAASIGNDTGPMHLIAPTGCPSYVLFSRHSNPVRHAPKGANVRTIQVNDLKDLSPDDVAAEISEL